jgi:hypothetical protein
MSRAVGVGPITDEVCRDYIAHMDQLILGGLVLPKPHTAAG